MQRRHLILSCLLILPLLLSCGSGGDHSERAVRKWVKEHRVPDKEIEARIQEAVKDSARLNALPLEEMTVDAWLLQFGKPADMYVNGDTTMLVSNESTTYIFVRDKFDSSIDE